MREVEKGLKEALQSGEFYDYIANHYYEFTKDQLKEIILNLDWAATGGRYYNQEEELYKTVDEELDKRDFYED